MRTEFLPVYSDDCRLAARGESTIGRVPSAAGADARRRDAGDAVSSSRSANAADAPAPPEPFGRMGIVGNLCVARRQRCPRIASSSHLDLARNTHARDLLYFHHGLLMDARLGHSPQVEKLIELFLL
jgi:hypothetical protein